MRSFILRGVRPAVLAGVLISAPTFGGDDPPKIKTGGKITNVNNLRKICSAIINCSKENKGLMPQDIVDKAGKPLLSWRVAILPFVEQEELYAQFKLDEPWDSDNNKKLIAKIQFILVRPG